MVPAPPLRHLAFAAALVCLASATHAETEQDRLLRAVQDVWLEVEPDHARVREESFQDMVVQFAGPLGRIVAQPGLWNAKPEDDWVAPVREAVVKARRAAGRDAETGRAVWTLSPTSTALVLRRFAGKRAPEAGVLVQEFSALFAKDRFADCWDAGFLELPEVRAWRAFNEKAAQAPTPPPVPVVADPGVKPPDLEKPPPAQPEPAEAKLVLVDKAHPWFGPWTGWVQDIKEKDNKRQKRGPTQTKSVWIDEREVTRGDYLKFLRGVDAMRRRMLLPNGWSIDDAGEAVPPAGALDVPVTAVNYVQAVTYAESQGKRLPTEDEWERAAAGGDKEGRLFPWGGSSIGKRWAFLDAQLTAPSRVGEFPDDVTPDGISGLAGNVAEMVSTLSDRREVPAKLPEAFDVVVRGGSYRSRDIDCQTTFRWVVPGRTGAEHVGFRCVMDEAEYRKRFR